MMHVAWLLAYRTMSIGDQCYSDSIWTEVHRWPCTLVIKPKEENEWPLSAAAHARFTLLHNCWHRWILLSNKLYCNQTQFIVILHYRSNAYSLFFVCLQVTFNFTPDIFSCEIRAKYTKQQSITWKYSTDIWLQHSSWIHFIWAIINRVRSPTDNYAAVTLNPRQLD